MMIALCACGTTPKRHGTEASLRVWTEPRPGQKEHLIRETWMEDDTPDYANTPTSELERRLRMLESEGRFGPETTALRVLIEIRRAKGE